VAQTMTDGVFRLTLKNWFLFTHGYDGDIACEKAGAPPSGGVPDWLSHWGHIFQALNQKGGPQGAYTVERPDLYLNHIVEQRRAVGLPDLPRSFTDDIPPPPAHGKTPDWIEHSDVTAQATGSPQRVICMPPRKTAGG